MEHNQKILVLVVEDREPHRHTLCRIVESEGLTTVSAENEIQALEKIKNDKKVSLVLTDVKLDGAGGSLYGGIELVKNMENDNIQIPVVLLSHLGDYMFNNEEIVSQLIIDCIDRADGNWKDRLREILRRQHRI